MNKNEFLELLKNKLDVLEESEVLDIVNEYSEHIDEKIKKNISEEEAIKEFGDIDLLCSSILSAYKINQKYINDKKDSFITNFLNDTKYVFDKIICASISFNSSGVIAFTVACVPTGINTGVSITP